MYLVIEGLKLVSEEEADLKGAKMSKYLLNYYVFLNVSS